MNDMKLTKDERRELIKGQRKIARSLPEHLIPVPREKFPNADEVPIKAWWSRFFLVQLYPGKNIVFPEMMRLSIVRNSVKPTLEWKDGILWEEIQAIKHEVGFGDWYGLEIFPRDRDVVAIANIRHLWLLPQPLPIGWETDK